AQTSCNSSCPPRSPELAVKPNPLILFLRLSRPWYLPGGALFYLLGVGIARYLGVELEWGVVLTGQLWVSAMQLCVHYLNEYFDHPLDAGHPTRTPFSGGSGALGTGEGQLRPQVALVAAGTALALLAAASNGLARAGVLNTPALVVMALIFF